MFGCKRVLLALAIWSIALGSAEAQRSIPDDNLAFPALIVVEVRKGEVSTGSGFFMSANGKMYLVTAKHVLFDQRTQEKKGYLIHVFSPARDLADGSTNHFILNLDLLQKNDAVKTHSTQDVAIVGLVALVQRSSPNSQEAKKYSSSPLPGVTIAESTPSGVVQVPRENTKTLDQILIGNDVILFGYPSSLGLAEQPQLDPSRPLLRKGMVAGANLKRKVIVVDCFSYPGNSGGPIIQVEANGQFGKKFTVIGILGEWVPFVDRTQRGTLTLLTNSGYSIAAPIDAVLNLLKEE